jgi:hypothetical protein
MRIDPPEILAHRGALTSSLPVTATGTGPAPSTFTLEVVDLAPSLGDREAIDTSVAPFVPMASVGALLLGQDLDIGAAISAQQADGARAATTMLGGWLERTPPAITVPVDDAPSTAPAAGVGLFFTRGVDSWSSLLEHRDHVTHLLFIDGVEPRMSAAVRARVRSEHERVAADLGLPLVTLRTNGRVELDAWASWEYTHGAILASAALLLAPLHGEVLVAASHAPRYTKPWGTHADLDPLWSTPTVTFRHDGRGLTRWEKIERIATCPPALDSLHVCWMGGSDRNCGRCPKCMVTMSALHALGALDRCPRFDAPLDLDRIAAIERLRPGRGANVVDLLCHLSPDDPLAQAWVHAVDPAMLEGTAHAPRR